MMLTKQAPVIATLLLLAAAAVHAACPYASTTAFTGNLVPARKLLDTARQQSVQTDTGSQQKAGDVDYAAVEADLTTLLTDSQPFWPADSGNYGGLFIRLAWHCSGSYRSSDGRGGCDGGRIRFNPEHSWRDNANLDKALRLLQPIKLKYRDALSWGDLIVLSGNVAIEASGGPIIGFCGGRQDDEDGSASITLGPSPEQEAVAPCGPDKFECKDPLGPHEIGLIYVNPEGPGGNGDPVGSANGTRTVFARMGMNDRETTALIGGGHAFGKSHGACPNGGGPDPTQDPIHPWPGTCGSGADKGIGPNTFTSGLEGSWTTTPDKWSNEYFTNLRDLEWHRVKSPAGGGQWAPNTTADIMMLTSDIALIRDPKYLALVNEFAADKAALEEVFGAAWYKLTTPDMGPAQRCLGGRVPPAQPFQGPLPPAPRGNVDLRSVRRSLASALTTASAALPSDTSGGQPYYGALFATLAYQCASTYRNTDHRYGCNGAFIRFAPEAEFAENVGMDRVIAVLEPVKAEYGDALTWADLIVLAGTTAVEQASGGALSGLRFCPGRSDAAESDAELRSVLKPRDWYTNAIVAVRDNQQIMGLTSEQAVALSARLRSPSQQIRLGFSGSYAEPPATLSDQSSTRAFSSSTAGDPATLSNQYFISLLTETWDPVVPGSNGLAPSTEYKARGKPVYMTALDLALVWDPEYKAISQRFASDNAAFLEEFGSAWTQLMNADRFDGRTGNVCD